MPRCTLVAEIGQAHDGSLGTAHAYIDAAARAGADAVKFQTHLADAESTPSEPWRVRFSPQDETRFDYWRRMEFTEAQWQGLREHAHERDLTFLSSPFSTEAVELLERIDIDAYKIASGEVSNGPLLERIAETGRPVVISSGMSDLDELDRAVRLFDEHAVAVTLLQCTSQYPCPPERVGLNVMEILRERYGHPAGLSDHSGTIWAGLAAATLGATMLEVHVTLSREAFGPDVTSSVTIDELALLSEGLDFVGAALDNPVDKDALAGELEPMRRLFTRSIVVREALPAGTTLTDDHLALRKPGTGLGPDDLPVVVGRTLVRDVPEGHLLRHDDIEAR